MAKEEEMSMGGSWWVLAEYEGGGELPWDRVCRTSCLSVTSAFLSSIGSGTVGRVLNIMAVSVYLMCKRCCADVDSFSGVFLYIG